MYKQLQQRGMDSPPVNVQLVAGHEAGAANRSPVSPPTTRASRSSSISRVPTSCSSAIRSAW